MINYRRIAIATLTGAVLGVACIIGVGARIPGGYLGVNKSCCQDRAYANRGGKTGQPPAGPARQKVDRLFDWCVKVFELSLDLLFSLFGAAASCAVNCATHDDPTIRGFTIFVALAVLAWLIF